MLADFNEDFLRFYEGVDEYVSSNVRPGRIGHSETACTANLLMSLDATEPPTFLPFNAKMFCDRLSAGLREKEVTENFKFICTAHGFSQNHEGAITQSDYAIRMRRYDNSAGNNSVLTSSVLFFQAKIMRANGSYEVDDEQHQKIETLREFIGSDGLLYTLYGPWETGGIRLADHPDDESFPWAQFMADWATGSLVDTGAPMSAAHRLRHALLDNNKETNDRIARVLKTRNQDWKPYEPAVIEIGIAYPAYTLDHIPKPGRGARSGRMWGMTGSSDDV
ncbi:hypothetical protein ACK9YZ_16930 [Rhizobium sp. ZK1]|uniref:hypothetical protein n=1 Tax=Rhizobium sp. ZK1 TaxID=3389872 RepID=UPI0039F7086F